MIKPLNSVLVTLSDKPLQDEIQVGELKLYIDPTYNPSQNVSVTSKIAVLPEGYDGDLKQGDEVAVSFRVVANRTPVHSHEEVFTTVHDDDPHFRAYISQKSSRIQVVAYKGAISKLWVGTYVDKFNELISGVNGTEKDLEKWLTQFTFAKTDRFNFDNLIELDGKQYWKCGLDQIYAKKVKGKVVSVSDRVICKPIEWEVKGHAEIISGKPLPFRSLKMKFQDRAHVVSGGEKLGLQEGDIVGFDQLYKESYTLWGNEYYLVKNKRILGQWQ